MDHRLECIFWPSSSSNTVVSVISFLLIWIANTQLNHRTHSSPLPEPSWLVLSVSRLHVSRDHNPQMMGRWAGGIAKEFFASVCSKLRTVQEELPRTATTWQLTATHCNTLQHTVTHCNILQHTATHCNILQHTATHCNILQHTATHCNTTGIANRRSRLSCHPL